MKRGDRRRRHDGTSGPPGLHAGRRRLLDGVSIEGVDRQVLAVGAPQFVDAKRARDRHRADREVRRPARPHPHDHAVVQRGTGAEAAFLVV
ncbi:MAG: hypothetical protein ACK55I_28000, partial [bacterium]